MRAVVTGAAGFVGSTLCEALLDQGHHVVGIDAFTDYYDPDQKTANVAGAVGHPDFELVADDICDAPLDDILAGADVVWHQAGQPGVRASWAAGFEAYTHHNVLATQRLLEAARRVAVPRVVYASSSSVYGNALAYPTTEGDLPRPHSPYGVTKLAAEHLCNLYAANYGLSTVSLRYFTVYGPRQRPDMAFRRLVEAALTGTAFPLFGTGAQVRDFTHVRDVVAANLLAGGADVAPGTVVNISGGSNISLAETIALVEAIAGTAVTLDRRPAQAGDVDRTGGSADQAARLLGWAPSMGIEAGLATEVDWVRAALALA